LEVLSHIKLIVLIHFLNRLVYKLSGSLVYNFFYKGEDYPSYSDFEKKIWHGLLLKAILMYGVAFFIIFPSCMIKNIGKMKFVSLLSIISILYVILVI